MSTELTITSAIEQVKNLPQLQIAREETIAKATTTCNNIVAKIKAEGRTEANMELAKQATFTLRQRVREFEAARKPATQALDEIKKPFIAHEKALEALLIPLQAEIDAQAKEQHEKQKQLDAANLLAQNKQIEEARIKANWQLRISEFSGNVVRVRTEQIATAFSKLTVDNESEIRAEIEGLCSALRPEQVMVELPQFEYLALEQVMAICKQPDPSEANTAILTALNPIKDKYLNELVPGKLKALKDGVSAAKIAEAENAQAEALRLKQQEEKEAAERLAESETQKATFNVISEAAEATVVVPTVVKSKVKQKVVPLDSKGWLAVVGYWLTSCGETNAELSKRFSVQLNYATKAVNADLLAELSGCMIQDEVTGK